MTRERLKAYRDLKAEKEQIENKIEEIEQSLYEFRIANNDGMPRGSSGVNFKKEILIDKKTALIEKYQKMVFKLSEEVSAIEYTIDSLESSRERRLMRYYYIDGLNWEKVCCAMNYSWSQVHRIHASALRHLGI